MTDLSQLVFKWLELDRVSSSQYITDHVKPTDLSDHTFFPLFFAEWGHSHRDPEFMGLGQCKGARKSDEVLSLYLHFYLLIVSSFIIQGDELALELQVRSHQGFIRLSLWSVMRTQGYVAKWKQDGRGWMVTIPWNMTSINSDNPERLDYNPSVTGAHTHLAPQDMIN